MNDMKTMTGDAGRSGTGNTFEDRLLVELRQEIALGAGDRPVPEPVRQGRRPGARRLAVGLAACGVAGAALVAVPGGPAETPAYAVEQNPDGTVEISLADLTMPVDEQQELAEKLRGMGVETVIDNPPPGTRCQSDRGAHQSARLGILGPLEGEGDMQTVEAYASGGGGLPAFEEGRVLDGVWHRTLDPSDTFIIENLSDAGDSTRTPVFSYVEGEAAPCDPH